MQNQDFQSTCPFIPHTYGGICEGLHRNTETDINALASHVMEQVCKMLEPIEKNVDKFFEILFWQNTINVEINDVEYEDLIDEEDIFAVKDFLSKDGTLCTKVMYEAILKLIKWWNTYLDIKNTKITTNKLR